MFNAKELLAERKEKLAAHKSSPSLPTAASRQGHNSPSASSPMLHLVSPRSATQADLSPQAVDDRELISVLDKFLSQKKVENTERLAQEEAAWEADELEEGGAAGEDVKVADGEGGEPPGTTELEKEKEAEIEAKLGGPPSLAPIPQMKWKVRIFAVVNRLSGKGKKADVEEVLRREGGFRWKWEIFYIKTGKEDMASAIKQRVLADRDFDWVFACGGDGTVSSIVSLLSGTGIPIGVIPLGTGNAFAQEMKIPLNWKHAIQMVSRNHVRRTLVARAVDVMEVGNRYCMLTIDIGIGAKTVEDAANHAGMKRRLGVWAYLISAGKAMANQEPQLFTVNVDGNIIGMVATEVVLCNAGMVGVGHDIRWGPNISVDDGAIDLVFIDATSVQDYVSVIKALGTGTGTTNSRVKYLRAYDYIEISSKDEAPVAADGDLLGTLPLKIKVIRGAANVLLPQQQTPHAIPAVAASSPGGKEKDKA